MMIKKTCAIRAGMAARVGVRYFILLFFYKAKRYGCVRGNLYTKSFTPVPIAAAQGNKKKQTTAPDAGGKMPPRDY